MAETTTDIFTKVNSKLNSLIAASRTKKNKLKDSKFNNKVRSVKNKLSKFLIDLLLILGVIETFFREINDFFGKVGKYEPTIKKTLIDCFNANIACNLDSTFKIGDVYNSINPVPYFVTKINKIDFFGIFKINPNSIAGKTLYQSIDKDLNRAIKEAIDTGTLINWNNHLLIELDSIDRNQLNFYIPQSYLNKPISSLVNDLVNKIQLIPDVSLLLTSFDNLYGSFSYSIEPRPDPRSLFNRTLLHQYVDKILDGGDDLIIDDSFFSFTNEELNDMETLMQNLSNNFLEILSCNSADSVITPADISSLLNQLISGGTYNEKIDIINAGMSTLQSIAAKNINRQDFPKFKIEFYTNLFDSINKSIVNAVYSPQFLTIMFIYFRLSNPSSNDPFFYEDFKDFLKKSKNILQCIVLSIFKLLLLLLVIPIIIKELTHLVSKEKIERNREKIQNYIAQIFTIKGTIDALKNGQLLSELISSL